MGGGVLSRSRDSYAGKRDLLGRIIATVGGLRG